MIEIRLKNAVNVRDLGDTPTMNGTVIKPHCLIRSAKISELSENDIKVLTDQFGLKVDIDLRVAYERQNHPDLIMPGVDYQRIPLREDITGGERPSLSLSFAKFSESMPTMPQMYFNMVTKEDSLDALRKIFTIIFEQSAPGNAVLFHCTEGKDRTEIVTMLILKLLDVDEEFIVSDYMFTNRYFKRRNRRAAVFFRIMLRSDALRYRWKCMCEAQEFMLRDTMHLLEVRDGGVRNFFINTLGFTEEAIDTWAARITE